MGIIFSYVWFRWIWRVIITTPYFNISAVISTFPVVLLFFSSFFIPDLGISGCNCEFTFFILGLNCFMIPSRGTHFVWYSSSLFSFCYSPISWESGSVSRSWYIVLFCSCLSWSICSLFLLLYVFCYSIRVDHVYFRSYFFLWNI